MKKVSPIIQCSMSNLSDSFDINMHLSIHGVTAFSERQTVGVNQPWPNSVQFEFNCVGNSKVLGF